jgi:uncharacterized protein (DUF1330 family)
MAETMMAKGYWIARVDVRDPERYKDYVAAAKPAFEQYGAVFLARGGDYHRLEGQVRARYHSEQYQKAAAIRQQVADAEMVIVEGI